MSLGLSQIRELLELKEFSDQIGSLNGDRFKICLLFCFRGDLSMANEFFLKEDFFSLSFEEQESVLIDPACGVFVLKKITNDLGFLKLLGIKNLSPLILNNIDYILETIPLNFDFIKTIFSLYSESISKLSRSRKFSEHEELILIRVLVELSDKIDLSSLGDSLIVKLIDHERPKSLIFLSKVSWATASSELRGLLLTAEEITFLSTKLDFSRLDSENCLRKVIVSSYRKNVDFLLVKDLYSLINKLSKETFTEAVCKLTKKQFNFLLSELNLTELEKKEICLMKSSNENRIGKPKSLANSILIGDEIEPSEVNGLSKKERKELIDYLYLGSGSSELLIRFCNSISDIPDGISAIDIVIAVKENPGLLASSQDKVRFKKLLFRSSFVFDELGQELLDFIFETIEFTKSENMKLAKIKCVRINKKFSNSLDNESMDAMLRSSDHELKLVALASVNKKDKKAILEAISFAEKGDIPEIIELIDFDDDEALFILEKSLLIGCSNEISMLLKKAIKLSLSDLTIRKIRNEMINNGIAINYIVSNLMPESKEEITLLLKASVKDKALFSEIICYIDKHNIMVELDELIFELNYEVISAFFNSKKINESQFFDWVKAASSIECVFLHDLEAISSIGLISEILEKAKKIGLGDRFSKMNDSLLEKDIRQIISKTNSLDFNLLIDNWSEKYNSELLSVLSDISPAIFHILSMERLSKPINWAYVDLNLSKSGGLGRKEEMFASNRKAKILDSNNIDEKISVLTSMSEKEAVRYLASFGANDLIYGKIGEKLSLRLIKFLSKKGQLFEDETILLSNIVKNNKSEKILELISASNTIKSVLINSSLIPENEKNELIKKDAIANNSEEFTEEDLDLILSSKYLSEIVLLSSEGKSKLISRLIDADFNEDQYINLIKSRDLIGIRNSDISDILFRMEGASRLKVTRNYLLSDSEERLFSWMDDDTRVKLLDEYLENYIEGLDQVGVDSIISKISKTKSRKSFIRSLSNESSIKTLLSSKLISRDDISDFLSIDSLNEMELGDFSFVNPNYVDAFLNGILQKYGFDITEDPNEETFIVRTLSVNLLTIAFDAENKFKFNFFTKFSIDKEVLDSITKKIKSVLLIKPKVITGFFSVKELEFISGEITISGDEIVSLETDFANGIEALKGVMRFSPVKRIPAVARRAFDKYHVTLDFSNLGLKRKNNLHKKLVERRTDIRKELDSLIRISPNRKFGFELEISANKSKTSIAKEIRKNSKNPVSVKNDYYKSQGSSWDIKYDQSVLPVNGFAMEIASPILIGTDGINESKSVLDSIFKKFDIVSGETVNGGLHIHHDISDILKIKNDVNAILSQFYPFQEAIYQLCANYRQKNEYCERLDLDRLGSNEYELNNRDGFNLSSIGTMEFRMKESISSTDPVIRWIKLTQSVVSAVSYSLKNQTDKFKEKAELVLDAFDKEALLQANEEMQSELILDRIKKYTSARNYAKSLLGVR